MTLVRYRRPLGFRSFAAGAGEKVVVAGDGPALRLPAPVADVCERLLEFDTLERHANRLAGGGGGGAGRAMMEVLQALASRGLLLSERELAASMRGAATRGPTRRATLRRLVLPTRNRPALVERCIDSYLAHAREHGRMIRVLVIDGSDTRAQAATKAATSRLARRHAQPIDYADGAAVHRFGRRLARAADVDPEVVEFALSGRPGAAYGAMRNRALLALAGEAFLSVDDDTICESIAPPELCGGLLVSGSPRFSDPHHFERRRDAIGVAVNASADFIGAHERMLGRPPFASVADGGVDEVRFDAARDEQLARVVSPEARVVVTAAGYLGDAAGCVSAEYLDPADRDRVVSDAACFRRMFTARTMLRVVGRPTITEATGWPAMTSGYDGRRLLPPFFPSFRGEEATFAAVLRSCFPTGLVGLVPMAIRHLPAEPRANRMRGLRAPAVRASVAALLLSCLKRAPGPQPGGDEARLLALAEHLGGLARSEPPALAAFLHQELAAELAAQIEWLERLLHRHRGQPDFWARIVEQRRRSLARALGRPEAILAAELRARDLRAGTRALQRLLDGWSRLLAAWPSLWHAARELRASGRGAGELVRP